MDKNLNIKSFILTLTLAMGFSTEAARAQPGFTQKNACEKHFLSPELKIERIDELVEKHLEWTQELFEKIRRKHGFSDSHYVFVGRSPTLLAAYLEASKGMYPDIQSSILPISLTQGLYVPRAVAQQRFAKVFNAFVPSGGTKPKKLIFIDFISNGRTFSELEKLLLGEGITQAQFIGFTSNVAFAKALTKDTIKHFAIEIAPISLEAEKYLGEHKILAPYPSHKILSPEYPDIPNLDKTMIHPNFQMTILSIQKEMFF